MYVCVFVCVCVCKIYSTDLKQLRVANRKLQKTFTLIVYMTSPDANSFLLS